MMTYKYEKEILDSLITYDWITDEKYEADSKKEIEEVYRKAKAFDEILRHANDEYKAPETKVELIIETIQYYMEGEK